MNVNGRGAYTFAHKTNQLFYLERELIRLDDRVMQVVDDQRFLSVAPLDFWNEVAYKPRSDGRMPAKYDVAESTIDLFMSNSFDPVGIHPPRGIVLPKTWDGYDLQNDAFFDVKSHNAGENPSITIAQFDKLKNNIDDIHDFFVSRKYVSDRTMLTTGLPLYGVVVGKKQFEFGKNTRSSIFVFVYYFNEATQKGSKNVYCIRYIGGRDKERGRVSFSDRRNASIAGSK